MAASSRPYRSLLVVLLTITAPACRGDSPSGGLSGAEQIPVRTIDAARIERLDAYYAGLVPTGYSGAVLVAHRGKIALRRGYGAADREAGRPASPDTVFTVGSITKQFTAAAILALQEAGKVSVGDPLSRWFLGVPADKRWITIHHLLTHTAGLPQALGADFDRRATREWLIRESLATPTAPAPGASFAYSNVGYSLAGAIVELASDQPYEAYIRERLLVPAGMQDTGYFLPRYEPTRLAIGYRQGRRWGSVLDQPMLEDGPTWNLRANGGIHSTVDDMYRWYRALRDDTVLSEASRQALFGRHARLRRGWYGYGWVIRTTRRSTTLVNHTGGNTVFSADARMYWDEDLFVFHTSSSADHRIADLSDELERLLLDGG